MQGQAGKQFIFPKHSFWTNFFLLKEDNVRFMLLAIVIIIYMILGAAIFQILEEGNEIDQVNVFQKSFSDEIAFLKQKLNSKNVTLEQVESLMYLWGNASVSGLILKNRRWDYGGSFHFVYTVVSTIGEFSFLFSVCRMCVCKEEL